MPLLSKSSSEFTGTVAVLERGKYIHKLRKSFQTPRTTACSYKNDREYWQYTQTSTDFCCKLQECGNAASPSKNTPSHLAGSLLPRKIALICIAD